MYCRNTAAGEMRDKANIQVHLSGLLLDSREGVCMGLRCVLEESLVCMLYCGWIAADPRAAFLELGQVPAC